MSMRPFVTSLRLPSRAILVTLLHATVASCGSVGDDRAQALDTAAKATCDRYNACGAIAPGKMYETADSCTTDWRANWDKAWPTSACQGKIDQSALSVCVSAIDGTSCDSIVDFLTTLGKCAKEKICLGAADGGA